MKISVDQRRAFCRKIHHSCNKHDDGQAGHEYQIQDGCLSGCPAQCSVTLNVTLHFTLNLCTFLFQLSLPQTQAALFESDLFASFHSEFLTTWRHKQPFPRYLVSGASGRNAPPQVCAAPGLKGVSEGGGAGMDRGGGALGPDDFLRVGVAIGIL
jgi:hypothetical protein